MCEYFYIVPGIMSYLPLFLNIKASKPALIIGGGEIAAAKIEALVSVGATVEVIAKKLSPAVVELCDAHGFAYQEAVYQPSQLDGKQIVIAATDDHVLNEQIAADCCERGILVNVVDNTALCDFIFPALVKRGPLQIAISTSGISPVLARMIKQIIEKAIPVEFERVINFLQGKREVILKKLSKIQPRRLFGEQVINGPVSEELLEDNVLRAEVLFNEALNAWPNEQKAGLYLIGTGPGNPELMTLKAIRLLSQADVVLYDRLTAPELLEQYARKDAVKVFVGKTRCHHHKKQSEIDELLEQYLIQGKIVARLKGGDPGIYAHGAEEIAIARKVGAPYQIVPGITAANGCAAYAGIPLTERDGAKSVRFNTLYEKQMQDDDFWESLRYSTQETLVFYMSSKHYGALCEQLLGVGFAPDTPFVAIEQGTTPYHRELPGTLATFEEEYGNYEFASPTLLIVGDVVRWRESHGWKEAPQDNGNYFAPLPPKEAA